MLEYNSVAQRYQPSKIKVLFIAESPPAFESSDKKSYFYFENNPGSDILFATLIKSLFDIEYKKADSNKPELLTKLKDNGFWLIDAVQTPINKINGKQTRENERELLIKAAIPVLLSRMAALKLEGFLDDNTGIILIKKNIFAILSPILSEQEFRVLNQRKIDFPKYYCDRDTIREIQRALQGMD